MASAGGPRVFRSVLRLATSTDSKFFVPHADLRQADAVARRLSKESGYDSKVWQFPVILIPLGTAEAPDSVVLRPVNSVDGMTAQSVLMDDDLLGKMCREIMEISGVAGVFYDLTHKPPGTIEWE